jgi:tetratricopeptide (TPR) repeat protein
MRRLIVVLAALTVISCNRDPNVAKRRYLENGNKYFAKGKYKEASIMYRNALQKDQRYGPAYYHLALTDLKLGKISSSIGELRRAIELIPKDQPDHIDAEIRLAEIYIGFAVDPQSFSEVEAITKELLQRDPNSYDGHRLTGDLDFRRAQVGFRTSKPDETRKLLDSAIAEYDKAALLKKPPNLQIQRARALAATHGYKKAEDIYRELITADKTSVAAYTELYSLYLVQNKVADAEQVLKKGAAANPKQVNFLVQLANFYSTLKRHDEMVAVLNQIKSRAKEFDRAYLVVGDFYFRNGDADEALRQYKEGMAADSKQKATYQKRMIEVLMRQGKRAEAAEINAAILKDNPKDSDARGLQASLLLDRGEVQKAISELQTVVSAAPDNFVARYNLGRAHRARGEWEQARQEFATAIRLRPDYIPARLALAQLQVMLKEYDAALKTVDETLLIDNRNGQARMIQAAALLGEKKYPEAQQLLDAMRKANPNSPDVNISMAMLQMSQGMYKQAAETFRKAYEQNPQDTRGLVGLVEALIQQNDYGQATKILQAELAKNPNRNELHMALGNVSVRAGNYDVAVAEFQKLLDSMDKNSRGRGEVYLRIGETLRRKGDLNGSVEALEKAKEVLPDNSVVVSTLALSLQGTGRKKEAQQAYEQAVKLDPRNAIALNNLAFLMYENGGDLDQALTYAQRAKQLLPNLYEVSDTLGCIYLKKNLSEDAVDILQQLVAKAPNNATYRYHLGMAYSQKGDKPKALKELQLALQSSPSKDDEGNIRNLMAKLQ